MRLVFALLSGLIGLMLVFGGYRLARLFIPIIGFLAGLELGGAVISNMQSTPFLGTLAGVTVGLIAGVIFALLAYAYYYLAVVILTGSLGYLVGSSFILLLGFQPGFLSAMIGLAVGVVFGLMAVFGNAAKYLLIIATAAAGAIATVGGVLLLFNQIPLDAYSLGTANIAIGNSFIWTVVTLILAIVGISTQIQTSREYELEMWAVTNAAMQDAAAAKPKSHKDKDA